MSDPIPVIADLPAAEPGLGFGAYADAIAAAVRGGDPPQFTVGVYGAWGSGKSTLLHAVRARLVDVPEVIPVTFDAWRYERVEHIVVPMLHEIQREVAKRGDPELLTHLRRALQAVVFSLNFKLSGVTLDMTKARDQWEKTGLPRLDSAFSEPFEHLRRISGALGDRRLVILIDDLDRCSPSKVVSVLEAINVIMDVPGLVFVLALDYDVLTAAVRQQYPHVIEPHVFIEKMVQLPFRVPPHDVRRESFLEELIPNWNGMLSDPSERARATLMDIAQFGLLRNPRQLKRLVNTFLLARRIAALREIPLNEGVLLPTLGLQLRWPDHYRRLHAALLRGSESPMELLTAEPQDEDLVKYVERFFDDVPNVAVELNRILEYTLIGAPEIAAEDPWG